MSNYTTMTGAAGDTLSIDLDTITISDTNNYITSTGSGDFAWTQPYSFSTGALSSPTVNISSNGITMPADTDITIGNKSIAEAIEKIEERLAILHTNPELEEKWQNLRDLRKAYMDLESEIIEKEKMWEILKKP
jgi:hypothetical protein